MSDEAPAEIRVFMSFLKTFFGFEKLLLNAAIKSVTLPSAYPGPDDIVTTISIVQLNFSRISFFM